MGAFIAPLKKCVEVYHRNFTWRASGMGTIAVARSDGRTSRRGVRGTLTTTRVMFRPRSTLDSTASSSTGVLGGLKGGLIVGYFAPLRVYVYCVTEYLRVFVLSWRNSRCGEFRNLTLFAELYNATGKEIMIENCHWGGDGPGTDDSGQNPTNDSHWW